ncbi:MAG: MiaB/RimO family radical SAM methylthiotransferase [Dehalococcoidia bacterium]
MPRPIAAVLTLGCKLNLADSEAIARRLSEAGFAVVDAPCAADAFVINTCSVTHVADQKSRKLVRSMRRLAPGATVAVTGCFPQSAGEAAVRELGADLVAGTREADQAGLVAAIAGRAGTTTRGSAAGERGTTGLHVRAFIKAQEGCNDVCAFCIVPQTRGREESRDITSVARDVQLAVDRGAREVVITGTQLGAWGRDLPVPLKPHHLIGGLLERTDVARIRFSSLQPQDITAELLGLWQDPRLMPHFHLALQSGSDATLSAMRRRYSRDEFIDAATRIAAAVPAAAITTDVIAGFPGESKADFEATLDLCREAGFARIHAFPYSPRAKTLAARMPDQIAPDEKQQRMARLLALSGELASAFGDRFVGALRPVLWEELRSGAHGPELFGHTDNYLPVSAAGDAALVKEVTPVRLHRGADGALRGEAISADEVAR